MTFRYDNIIISALGLALLAVLLFFVVPAGYGVKLPNVYYLSQSVFFMLMASLVIVNSNFLSKKFLFEKKFVAYYSILFCACMVILGVIKFVEDWLHVPEKVFYSLHPGGNFSANKNRNYFLYIFIIEILVLGLNISSIIIERWKKEERRRIEIEENKKSIELTLLKSQINPHFFSIP